MQDDLVLPPDAGKLAGLQALGARFMLSATLGPYSSTNGKQGPSLGQMVNDGIGGSVSGRQPMNDWDQPVCDWRSKGGDQIREEYRQALTARAST